MRRGGCFATRGRALALPSAPFDVTGQRTQVARQIWRGSLGFARGKNIFATDLEAARMPHCSKIPGSSRRPCRGSSPTPSRIEVVEREAAAVVASATISTSSTRDGELFKKLETGRPLRSADRSPASRPTTIVRDRPAAVAHGQARARSCSPNTSTPSLAQTIPGPRGPPRRRRRARSHRSARMPSRSISGKGPYRQSLEQAARVHRRSSPRQRARRRSSSSTTKRTPSGSW